METELIQLQRENASTDLAVMPASNNPISAMLQTLIEKGTGSPGETAAAMEKLTDLYLKVEANNARRAFATAKNALQAEIPKVIAKRIIPGNDGTIRSTFAAYEDIADIIKPYLTKHGFSVSYTMRNETTNGKDRICAVCKLTHVDGHSETNEFSVRVSPPPKSSEAQADGATRSYARRGALCDCLDVSIDHDDDARMEGAYIPEEVAKALRNRVIKSGAEEKAFLAMAKAESFEKIREGSYNILINLLDMKERQKKNAANATQPKSEPTPAQKADAEFQGTPHQKAGYPPPSQVTRVIDESGVFNDNPIIVPIPKVLLSWEKTHEAMVGAAIALGLPDGTELDAWLKNPEVAATRVRLEKKFDKESARNLLIAFVRENGGDVGPTAAKTEWAKDGEFTEDQIPNFDKDGKVRP